MLFNCIRAMRLRLLWISVFSRGSYLPRHYLVPLLLACCFPFHKAYAASLTVFEHEISAASQASATETHAFSAPISGNYTIQVYRRGKDGLDEPRESPVYQLPGGSIEINGSLILDWEVGDIRNTITLPSIPLLTENSIQLSIIGSENSTYRVEVLYFDSVSPSIEVSVDFDSNVYGWNNTPVTASFVCSDDFGVQSCPDPIVVQTDSENQLIAGTVEDYVGNTASTELTINLDSVAPTMDVEVDPPANSDGWNNTDVNLSFTCVDELSGMAECNAPVLLQEEGADQAVTALARDKAGNQQSLTTNLNIDKTPPVVNIQASAQPNAAGWYNTPVSFLYDCQDTLSGVVDCPEGMTVSSDGEGQLVSGSIRDLAGNSTEWQEVVNLDQTAPEVVFVSPANNALLTDVLPEIRLLLDDNLSLVDQGSLLVLADGAELPDCQINEGTATCNLDSPLPGTGQVSLQASVRDLAGNQQQATISVSLDSDEDSIADYLDLCTDTSATEEANSDGCALSQLDSDNDGVSDEEELQAGSDPNDGSSFPQVNIVLFEASPGSIVEKGQTVELRWEVQGAESIVLDANTGAEPVTGLQGSGTLEVAPSLNTRFSLTANGPGGEQIRTVDVTLDVDAPPQLWEDNVSPVQDEILSSLAVDANGNSYIGAFDGSFYKVSPNGEMAWSIRDFGVVLGKATILADTIIVGANMGNGRGMIYALSPDKTIQWSYEAAGAVVAAPLLSEDGNRVYAATISGYVYAVDFRTGKLIWQAELDGSPEIVVQPALVNDKLILNIRGGTLVALDTIPVTGISEANRISKNDRVAWEIKLE